MKRYKMSWWASTKHVPDHPERTAKRSMEGGDFDIMFQVWPNRPSMAKTIRMQEQAPPKPTHWKACVPLGVTEGY